jgi:4-hydroxybutyrate dehydrogenase
MDRFAIHPHIYMYAGFSRFAGEYALNERDLILTNEYIYKPYLAKYVLPCGICFQERYGNGEPSDIMLEAMMRDIPLNRYDRIIGIGGGTILDIAKLLALERFRSVDELFENPNLRKEKKLCLIPTTCGTGSEVTRASIVNRTRRGTKMGIVHDSLFADDAVLIPEFLESLPYQVFATSSIDALIHAVESYLNPVNNPAIELYALKAMESILSAYRDMAENGLDKRAGHLDELILASCYAGIAFANNGCGAVHALSYALGGKYHVAHGESNYQFFVEILRSYLKKKPGGKIERLNRKFNEILGAQGACFESLENVLESILPLKRMREYGAEIQDTADFTESTVQNQQRLLGGGYLPLNAQDILGIYVARL